MSFSYQGPGAVTERPEHVEPAKARNWARDPTSPEADDGTILDALLMNQIVANLRDLVAGANVPFDEADDMVLRAVRALADPTSLAVTVEGLAAATLAAALQELQDSKSAGDHGHAGASQSAAGFMSIADKAKLDTLTPNYRGAHRDLAALQAARPSGASGDYAVLINATAPASLGLWDTNRVPAGWIDPIAEAVARLVNGAPATLDTLGELSRALGDDASMATTITNALAGKASAADVQQLDRSVRGVAAAALLRTGGTMTGDLTLARDPDQELEAATKRYVDTAVGQVEAATTGAAIVGAIDTELGTSDWQSGGGADLALWAAIADLTGDRMNFENGVTDPFDDQTDVDTARSSGQTYDQADDSYKPRAGQLAGTWTMPNFGGSPASALHDGNPAVRASTGLLPRTATRSITARRVANIDLGSVKTVTRIDSQDIRFSRFGGQIEIYVSRAAAPTRDRDWTLVASHNENNTSFHSFQEVGSWQARHVALAVSRGGYDNSRTLTVGEFTASGPEDMTVVTRAFLAGSVPSTIEGEVELKEVDAVTANTDFTLGLSRNNGVTWTRATLAFRFTRADGVKVYEFSRDVSAQPSGSAIRLRFKTRNKKATRWAGHTTKWS